MAQSFETVANNVIRLYQRNELKAADSLVKHSLGSFDSLHHQGWFHQIRAGIKWKNAEYQDAILDYQRSIELLKAGGDTTFLINAYEGLGLCYKQIGVIDKALSYYYIAINLAIDSDNKEMEAKFKYLIANALRVSKNGSKAVRLYQELLDFHEDSTELARVYNSIGGLYFDSLLYDSAIHFYKKALAHVKPSSIRSKGVYLYNIGNSLLKAAQVDSAIDYLEASLEYREQAEDKKGFAKSYTALGDLFIKKRNWDLAGKYLLLAEAIADESGMLPQKKEIYELWILYFEGRRQYQEALNYSLQLLKVKDSLINEEIVEKTNFLTIQFEVEKIENALDESLEREQIQEESLVAQRNAIITLVVAVVLLVVIAFLTYRLFIQKKKEKEEVSLRMREQHHRIENNISILASILNLAAKESSSDEARLLALDGENRLNAMNMLHKELYWEEDQFSVKLDEYIGNLAWYLLSVYIKPGAIKNPLELRLSPFSVRVKTAIPLSLILNELITNAFKYGMSNEKPKLMIELSQAGEKLRLLVADNGGGIKSTGEFDNSFGTGLINTLTSQVGGSLEIDSDTTGLSVELTVPL